MKQPKVTLHLLANGKEIAASRAPVVPATLDWYFYVQKELIVQATPKQRWLALSDVTKQDGEIVMIVKANGQPIKSYKRKSSEAGCKRSSETVWTLNPAPLSFLHATSTSATVHAQTSRCGTWFGLRNLLNRQGAETSGAVQAAPLPGLCGRYTNKAGKSSPSSVTTSASTMP